MKFFIPVVAGLLAAGSVHAADDATNFKWGAEMRTRYEMWENRDLNSAKDSQNAFGQRNKLHMTMNKGEAITGHISLIHGYTWGKSTNQIPGTVDPTTGAAYTAYSSMAVSEAWGAWKMNDNTMLKWGRASMGIGDYTVVDVGNWGNFPNAFDGMGAMLNYDFANISLFGVKALDGMTAAAGKATDPEHVFYGVSADLKNLPEMLKMVNIHLMQVNKDETAARSQSGMRYGLTVKGDMSNVDFKATYAANDYKQRLGGATPEEIKNQGNMMDFAVGYSMPDMMNTRIGIVYHTDSGDDSTTADKDESYDTFYWQRHANAGLMDIVNWGNLTDIEVNLSMEPMEKTKVGFAYSMFSRTSDKAGNSFNVSGTPTTVASTSMVADKKALGTEIDLTVDHDYGNGFSVHGLYGMFTFGEALKPGGGSDPEPASLFLLQGKLVF